MKIAVIGAGAIGSIVAGYLKQKSNDVFLTGHPAAVEAINKNGLFIEGARGGFNIKIETGKCLTQACELAILAVKTQDLEKAVIENLEHLSKAWVITTQNGLQAEEITSRYIPKEKIISSIVMFGATCLEPGKVIHNFEGSWVIGRAFPENKFSLETAAGILKDIFPVVVSDDIRGMKHLKVFVNANNCIPAILGVSMQEAFSDEEISRISIAIWKEGWEIVTKAGIRLVSLPDFPLERLTKLLSLPPSEAAKIYSGIMANLSKEPLYGSILQSIKRGKPSEIDYINGEFVNIARKNNSSAPLNEKLAGLVHAVEKTGKFLDKAMLLKETQGLV